MLRALNLGGVGQALDIDGKRRDGRDRRAARGHGQREIATTAFAVVQLKRVAAGRREADYQVVLVSCALEVVRADNRVPRKRTDPRKVQHRPADKGRLRPATARADAEN